MQVKDFMRTQITTVPPDALVSTAYQMMTLRESRIRHLPVVARQNVWLAYSLIAMCVWLQRPMRRLWPSTSCCMCWKSCACATL